MSRGREKHRAGPASVSPYGKPPAHDEVDLTEDDGLLDIEAAMTTPPDFDATIFPQFHKGGAVSGRWSDRRPAMVEVERPEPYQMEAIKQLTGRGTKVMVMSPHRSGKTALLAAMDYSAVERRIMAQVAESMECEVNRNVFGEQTMRVARGYTKAVLEKTMRLWLAHFVESAISNMQTQMDEEGCGAVFAEIRTWKDQP